MTLLESGAKSLASHYGLDWDDLPQDPQHQGVHDFHCKAFWLGMSRAYLEGIRVPTEAMVETASGFPITRDLAADIWEAMVKTAAKETSK